MFYEKLKKELEIKNTNLNQVAKATGINQSATSRYKNGGMPNIDALIKICKYLNVSADYLLDLDDGAPPPVLTEQEKELLDHFRQCDAGTKENLILLAKAKADEIQKQERLLSSENAG